MSNEINGHFEKKKAYTFRTDHNQYTLVVYSDLLENESRLFLYVGEPLLYSFFGGLLKEENEAVREEIAGPNTDIEKLIYRMVGNYEICLHHHDIVKHMDKRLEIDHAELLRKRRERFIKPAEKTQEEKSTFPSLGYDIPIDDFFAESKRSEGDEVEQKRLQEVHEIANKNGMSVASVSSLKQYQKKNTG